MRLGLVLSEIGERNKIEVTDEEAQRALAAQMRQLPGQEQALLEYYRKNPEALASLRAPIFEEKVVDFLLELVKVTDKTVSREELMRGGGERGAPASGGRRGAPSPRRGGFGFPPLSPAAGGPRVYQAKESGRGPRPRLPVPQIYQN